MANAGFDVNAFSSAISKNGLASPNKFRIMFTVIPGFSSDELEQMNLMCDQVSIAGRTVQSTVNIEYGMRREIAYNAPTYTPITMSFLCSGLMMEKDILDRWNNMIVDPQKGFDVAYYDSYVGEMSVHVLGRDGITEPYHIHYHEVYPKTVAAVEMNHATTNSTLRVTAEMAYSYWTTKSIKSNSRDIQSKGNPLGQLGIAKEAKKK